MATTARPKAGKKSRTGIKTFFRSFGIKKKVTLGFGLMLLGITVIGALAVYGLHDASVNVEKIFRGPVGRAFQAQTLSRHVGAASGAFEAALAAGDAEALGAFRATFSTEMSGARKALAAMGQGQGTAELNTALAAFAATFDRLATDKRALLEGTGLLHGQENLALSAFEQTLVAVTRTVNDVEMDFRLQAERLRKDPGSRRSLERMVDRDFNALQALGKVQVAVGRAMGLVASAAESVSAAHLGAAREQAARASEALGATIKALGTNKGLTEAGGYLKGANATLEAMAEQIASVAAASATLAGDETERTGAMRKVLGALEGMATTDVTEAGSIEEHVNATVKGIGGTMALVFALVAMAGIGISTWIILSVTRPIDALVERLKDIATGQGDLTKRLPLKYVNCSDVRQCGKGDCSCFGQTKPCWSLVGSMQLDREKIECPGVLSGKVTDCSECEVFMLVEHNEIDSLANWFNVMLDKVAYMIRLMVSASREMGTVSDRLGATTTQLSRSNNTVATEVHSVATASEQMSSTVEDVARNTGMVNEAAEKARAGAANGAEVISESVASMQDIAEGVEQAAAKVRSLGEQSEQIGMVVEVIEDIADQTNLLALNAAIEAARAGDAGRGFAVVADEVRKLAEKTVRATKEIASIIERVQSEGADAVQAMERGQKSVSKGTELSARVGEAIRSIEAQVTNASGQTNHIAVAMEELSASINEMAANMERIAHMTDRNSGANKDIIQSVESVNRMAKQMIDLTSRFKV
jgi:methyl-accepting chemotaxis protein